MKKMCILTLVLVLTATVFTACRGTDTPMNSTGAATVPTVTESTTVPTTEATVPTTEDNTDVTTTPTDGEIDPTGNADDGMTNGNPATGDMARGRNFGMMR